ncbi:MAG TPA: ABC transporter permease [Gemmatimonadaceae bacterium]|nr:ABC transporter permease [Gemmatimonadaceae bacterium]
MDKLWAIFAREYVERVRSRWFIASTLFAPLILGSVIFLPPWLASQSKPSADVARIVIVDATGTSLGRRVAAHLNGGITGDTTRTQVRTVAPAQLAAAESLATADILSHRVRGTLVLDAGTVAGVQARYAGTNATAANDMAAIRDAVRQEVLALRLEQAGVSPSDAATLTRLDVKLVANRVTESGQSGRGDVNLLFAFAIAIVLYLSIFIYGQNVMRGVLEEKQSRVAEVVVSSVPATRLLQGKVLGVGAVGLTQIVLWLGGSFLLFEHRSTILEMLGLTSIDLAIPALSLRLGVFLVLYFLLGYLFYAALFAAVGALVSSEQEAQQVQLPVALLLVTSALFIQPILIAPEGTVARTISWIPFAAPIAMPLRLSVAPISGAQLAGSLLALAASCYVAIWIAARIYRVGLLMYGKRPAWREIRRWVWYSE